MVQNENKKDNSQIIKEDQISDDQLSE